MPAEVCVCVCTGQFVCVCVCVGCIYNNPNAMLRKDLLCHENTFFLSLDASLMSVVQQNLILNVLSGILNIEK